MFNILQLYATTNGMNLSQLVILIETCFVVLQFIDSLML
jgi:hypothetical protein